MGQIERRLKRRAAAKESLEAAVMLLERHGARLWEARCRDQLQRVRPHRTTPFELTPTEARVAEEAAGGKTNREIADALFISPKTVEANLARIYRKLGIGSRAELGAAVAERRARRS